MTAGRLFRLWILAGFALAAIEVAQGAIVGAAAAHWLDALLAPLRGAL